MDLFISLNAQLHFTMRASIFSWTEISFLILFRKDNTVQNGRVRAPFNVLTDELCQGEANRLT